MKGNQPPNLVRAIIPLAIGLMVVGWLVFRAVGEQGGWSSLQGSLATTGWPWALAGLFGLVFIRDLGYVLRLKWLSAGSLTWRQAIETTVLWEFASATTPGIVGGGAVAIWGLHRQGMTSGRSTALVFSTALLDELFYVLAVPPLLLALGAAAAPEDFDSTIGWGFFWTGWGLMLALAALIGFGLFLAPDTTQRTIRRVARWGALRRWEGALASFAGDLSNSAQAMKSMPWSVWLKAFLATIASWTARFLALVAVMAMVVAPIDLLEPFSIVARQLVMWVYLLISPTPGSSGVAEWLLGTFFDPWFALSPSPLAPAMTMLIWRMATHFIYLLIGVLVIPGWLRRTRRKS